MGVAQVGTNVLSESSLTLTWLFFVLIFTIYRQGNLAVENAEFPQPVLAGHSQRKYSECHPADSNIKF